MEIHNFHDSPFFHIQKQDSPFFHIQMQDRLFSSLNQFGLLVLFENRVMIGKREYPQSLIKGI